MAAQVDTKLVAALKQAKTNPSMFVFVAKGNDGKLLVDKKKINNKDADDAKKKCGGGTIYRGRCKGEEGLMVFEVGKEVSPTLASLTKRIIKQDAGLNCEVEYRFAADLAAELTQGETPGEAVNPAAAAPAPPPQPTQGGAAVMKRLNSMAAGIKAALAGPNKARVQTMFVSVNGLIKSKDFAAADTALDELEPLVATPASAPAAAAAPAAPPPAAAPPAATVTAAPQHPAAASPTPEPAADVGLAAEYERRVIALEPRVLEAQKTRKGEAKWMTLFMSAQDLGSEGEFAKALGIVDKIEALLQAAPMTNGAPALQQWQVACTEVKNQIRKVVDEITKAQHVNSTKAVVQVESILHNLVSPPSTQQDVVELDRWIRDDDVITRVEKPNAWGIPVVIREKLLPVLESLMTQLPA